MKRYILIFFIAIGLLSCNKHDCGDPSFTSITLLLKDKTTGELLVGEDRAFHPDSIDSLNFGFPFSASDSLIFLRVEKLDDGDLLFLKLSNDDVDTVVTSVGSADFDCFTLPKLTEMTYNGKMVFQGEAVGAPGRIVVIEK